MDTAHDDFSSLGNEMREEVRGFLRKEFQAKEASLESKMEKNKQQFLKAVNGNMRILDNLISDYTTRTHEQIKKQLQAKPSSSSKGGT